VQGDEEITTIAAGLNECFAGTAAKNCGSGGGGGNSVVGTGGQGGGGGGTIEITANGTIMVAGQVLANGGTGTNGVTNAGGGGGGSGGLVLLRGASIAVTGGISAAGGGPGAGALTGAAGSMGGVGRIRLDSTTETLPTSAPDPYRGPTFVDTTPVITRLENPMVAVFGQADRVCKYQITSATGAVSNFFDCTFGRGGSNTFTLESLFEGLNTVCLYVDGADTVAKLPEARNCIQVVRLFSQ
jgi:hypothetical protein